jgi:hypothetical protein
MMDLYTTQQSIFNYLVANADFQVIDTEIPQAGSEMEPISDTGYPAAYAVVRFNDDTKWPLGGAVGGPRHDETYSLVDILCVGPTPTEARDVAYAEAGVKDILLGFVPTGGGPLTKAGGGQVFTVGDGTATLPRRYIARVSFRYNTNMIIDE